MNGFTLFGIGRLAEDPERTTRGDTTIVRFCLISNDYAGVDKETRAPRKVRTSMWFTAFGSLGEAIADNARKGDQLIVQSHVRTSSWVDSQSGETKYEDQNIVDEFQFGAPGPKTRREREGRE